MITTDGGGSILKSAVLTFSAFQLEGITGWQETYSRRHYIIH